MTPDQHKREIGDCRESDETMYEVTHCDACGDWVDLEEHDANDNMHRGCRKREEAKREVIAWGM